MLNLKLKEGKAALDIPATSIISIEELAEKGQGCGILYSIVAGQNEFDKLSNGYGLVRKKWQESAPEIGPRLELTIADEKPRKLSVLESAVVARRELTDGPNGANTKVTLNLGGKVLVLNVLDTRDSIVGDE